MAIDYYSIGARIKHLRTKYGLSQKDLADLADVSRVHLANLERGEKIPSLELIINIANALKIPSDELLVDNLSVSISNHGDDDYYLLLDCSAPEVSILVENMKNLKTTLKKYTIK